MSHGKVPVLNDKKRRRCHRQVDGAVSRAVKLLGALGFADKKIGKFSKIF